MLVDTVKRVEAAEYRTEVSLLPMYTPSKTLRELDVVIPDG